MDGTVWQRSGRMAFSALSCLRPGCIFSHSFCHGTGLGSIAGVQLKGDLDPFEIEEFAAVMRFEILDHIQQLQGRTFGIEQFSRHNIA
jgi:hypothetical protein